MPKSYTWGILSDWRARGGWEKWQLPSLTLHMQAVWHFMSQGSGLECVKVHANSCQFMAIHAGLCVAIHGNSWQFMPVNIRVCIGLCGISCRVRILDSHTERGNPWHFVPTAPCET